MRKRIIGLVIERSAFVPASKVCRMLFNFIKQSRPPVDKAAAAVDDVLPH
jgi:hypothetical protein